MLHGDAASETFLSEIFGAPAFPARYLGMESIYEYGARAGVWRVLRLFRERRLPLTVFGVGMALARNPAVAAAMVADGHEIACHGWRWISYQDVDEATEREHLESRSQTIRRLTGEAPRADTGRDSHNTRRLVVEHGGFVYDADSTPTTCRTGSRSPPRTAPRLTSSSRTRSTPTTCALSRRCRASTPVSSSSRT